MLLVTHSNWGLPPCLQLPRILGVCLGLGLTYVAAMWSMQRCRNSTWGLYVTQHIWRLASGVWRPLRPLPPLSTPDPPQCPTPGSINMRILHSPLRWPWTEVACSKKARKQQQTKQRAQETGADLGLRYLHNSHIASIWKKVYVCPLAMQMA